MNYDIIHLYNVLPKCIQKIIDLLYFLCPKEIKFGMEYRRYYNKLKKAETYALKDKEKYLLQDMKALLIYCKKNVSYYRKLFKEIDFQPEKLQSLSELEQIPMVDKEYVIANTEEFLADYYKVHLGKLRKITTGGTTGKQMVIYEQRHFTEAREQAYFDYLFSKEGYRTGKKMAVIRNDYLGDSKLWEWDWRTRKLIINPFLLDDISLGKIIDKLNKEKILYFHTYPSTMMKICQYIKRTGHGLSYKPKAIFASSENIYIGQRENIEECIGCKLLIHYGHSEKGAVAGWCTEDVHYHIEYSYGYLELVNEKNETIPCGEEGVRGEIVTTGFNNYAMPLVRYRTGDYAKYENHDKCANFYCLESIEGRWKQEMLVRSDGSKVSLTSVNVHSDIFDRVEKYQFYQDVPGVCYLHIVRGTNFIEEDAERILYEMQKRMGEKLQIEIKYVDDVIKTKSGKYCFLVQNIKE